MKKYTHVLAAIDLSDSTDKVIVQAKELAQLFSAKVSIIHVVEPLPAYGYAFMAPCDFETELLAEAKKQVKKLGEKYSIDENDRCVELGVAKISIIEKAKEEGVDLIVVGTHSSPILAGVLGSTANAIIHNSDCDVLTFKVNG